MTTRHTIAHSVSRLFLIVCSFIALLAPTEVTASTSSHYQIQEDFVGGSGNVRSTSSSYIDQDSLGGLAAGPAAGTAYASQSGATTTNDPTLTFRVNTSTVNLGTLSTSLTRTGTATFSVINYTSYGYVVQIVGTPPNNGSHTLNGLSSQTSSSVNNEQFGINLVANSSPAALGADPQQIPDSTFSFGAAATGYNTTNVYKYVSGDTIASATKSSGQTLYTISYIANIANNTQGGSYSSSQTLVCTGTY